MRHRELFVSAPYTSAAVDPFSVSHNYETPAFSSLELVAAPGRFLPDAVQQSQGLLSAGNRSLK